MNIPISASKFLDKQKLYEIAEYAVLGLVLMYGAKHIKQIIVIVLMELYKYLVQKNFVVPIAS